MIFIYLFIRFKILKQEKHTPKKISKITRINVELCCQAKEFCLHTLCHTAFPVLYRLLFVKRFVKLCGTDRTWSCIVWIRTSTVIQPGTCFNVSFTAGTLVTQSHMRSLGFVYTLVQKSCSLAQYVPILRTCLLKIMHECELDIIITPS